MSSGRGRTMHGLDALRLTVLPVITLPPFLTLYIGHVSEVDSMADDSKEGVIV